MSTILSLIGFDFDIEIIMKELYRKIRGFLSAKKSWYRNKRKFYWMTHQMHMVDPAQDDRPKYWKKCGVDTTGHFRVGYGVYFDAGNAQHIHIGDGTWISSRCLLLCHKRNLSNYIHGSDINKMPYIISDIHIGKGVHIGMDTIIMPGVTIGDGAIIGAGSLVTKDIPAWTVAIGRPAKPVRDLRPKVIKDE